MEDYLAKKIKVDEFATHSMPLDDINKAFELMHDGKRSVIFNSLIIKRSVTYDPMHEGSVILKTPRM